MLSRACGARERHDGKEPTRVARARANFNSPSTVMILSADLPELSLRLLLHGSCFMSEPIEMYRAPERFREGLWCVQACRVLRTGKSYTVRDSSFTFLFHVYSIRNWVVFVATPVLYGCCILQTIIRHPSIPNPFSTAPRHSAKYSAFPWTVLVTRYTDALQISACACKTSAAGSLPDQCHRVYFAGSGRDLSPGRLIYSFHLFPRHFRRASHTAC